MKFVGTRASFIKSPRARMAFVLISKIYRQMHADTGIATDSACVSRSAWWTPLVSKTLAAIVRGFPDSASRNSDVSWIQPAPVMQTRSRSLLRGRARNPSLNQFLSQSLGFVHCPQRFQDATRIHMHGTPLFVFKY